MLPNFLIIGAQKAATSWIARSLDQHPDVFVVGTEVYFFNQHFSKGLDWYEAQFRDWSGQSRVGEKTPGYLYHPEVPARVYETLGRDVKLIACLRHPVDRAYSAFWQYTWKDGIPENADFRTFFLSNKLPDLHDRGLYFTQLRRYLDIFPRENLLVLIYEELNQDRQRAMTDCLEFLGVNTTAPDAFHFDAQKLDQKVNRGRELRKFQNQAENLRSSVADKVKLLPRPIREPVLTAGRLAFEHLVLKQLPKKRDYAPLDENVRQELLVSFIPDIRRLEELLGRDLSVWTEPKATRQPRLEVSTVTTP